MRYEIGKILLNSVPAEQSRTKFVEEVSEQLKLKKGIAISTTKLNKMCRLAELYKVKDIRRYVKTGLTYQNIVDMTYATHVQREALVGKIQDGKVPLPVNVRGRLAEQQSRRKRVASRSDMGLHIEPARTGEGVPYSVLIRVRDPVTRVILHEKMSAKFKSMLSMMDYDVGLLTEILNDAIQACSNGKKLPLLTLKHEKHHAA